MMKTTNSKNQKMTKVFKMKWPKINLTFSLEMKCKVMNQDIHKTNSSKNNTFSNSK